MYSAGYLGSPKCVCFCVTPDISSHFPYLFAYEMKTKTCVVWMSGVCTCNYILCIVCVCVCVFVCVVCVCGRGCQDTSVSSSLRPVLNFFFFLNSSVVLI